jgi:hypothetical protein
MARPRAFLDITERQKVFLDALPHGWRQMILSSLLDMTIDMVDRCGTGALGAIITKSLKLEEYFSKEE